MREEGEDKILEQTFYNADGIVTRTGHKSRFTGKDTYVTKSFDIVDEAWQPRRSYEWQRQAPDVN